MWKNITQIQIGCAYVDASGNLVEITKEWEGGGRRKGEWFYESRDGKGYQSNGDSLTGDPHLRLVSGAQVMIVGGTYDFYWPGDQKVSYVVTGLEGRTYTVRYLNGADNWISFGSPVNRDSVLVSKPFDVAEFTADSIGNCGEEIICYSEGAVEIHLDQES